MDMGKYTQVVLWAYAGSVLLILALLAQSLWQAARIRQALRDAENRQAKQNG